MTKTSGRGQTQSCELEFHRLGCGDPSGVGSPKIHRWTSHQRTAGIIHRSTMTVQSQPISPVLGQQPSQQPFTEHLCCVDIGSCACVRHNTSLCAVHAIYLFKGVGLCKYTYCIYFMPYFYTIRL